MKEIRIDVSQFGAALSAHMQHVLNDLHEAAIGLAHEAVDEAKTIARIERVPDLGAYVAGMRVVQTATGPVVAFTAPHSGVVEHGRRAGKPAPPISVIAAWAERKLGIPNETTKDGKIRYSSAAWAIRKKIAEKGTKPRFVMLQTYRAMQAAWKKTIREILSTSAPGSYP